MNNEAIKISSEFRRMAIRSLTSIFLFILTYILLVICAFVLTLVFAYLGYLLFNAYPSWFTAIPGVMLVICGVIVVIFVIKFIFKRSEKIKPLLVEINATDEPELFKLIEEIVAQVKTGLPKKVYLSAEVNAGVFYDSLFLSMFFPVKMNLQIGMGILNTHTTEELKAVLAHEFGHFSQRSMRIGSYVHSANKVLHNLLYDDEKFNHTVETWGDTLSYFKLTGLLARVAIKGIQAILTQVYEILNHNYYALSREMEYHADAVAASVAGSMPVIASLLRMDLAETSLNIVHSYHESKVDQGVKPRNLYPQHYFVMNHFASLKKMEIKNGLPEINPDHIWKLRRSKIILTDKWASHPSIEDRIARIRALSIPNKVERKEPAINLLVQRESLQEALTSRIFEHHFIYAKAPEFSNFEQFRADFLDQSSAFYFDERYHEYYDERLPYYKFDPSLLDQPGNQNFGYQELFNDEGLSEIFKLDVLESDLITIDNIRLKYVDVASFRYDNVLYLTENCQDLIYTLEKEQKELKEKIERRNLLIFNFFKGQAQQFDKAEEWKEKYRLFKEVAESTFSCQNAYLSLSNASIFMSVQTSFTEIQEKIVVFKAEEQVFKDHIRLLLKSPVYLSELTAEQIQLFENYLSSDLIYFEKNRYVEPDLTRLHQVVAIFQSIYHSTCLKHKKDFLHYQTSLFPN